MWKSITSFLGLKRSVGALLVMVVLLGLGERMAERFLPLYLLALGGGALAVGLLNGMNNLLGALYSLPGGWASQRFGYKRALLIFNATGINAKLRPTFATGTGWTKTFRTPGASRPPNRRNAAKDA